MGDVTDLNEYRYEIVEDPPREAECPECGATRWSLREGGAIECGHCGAVIDAEWRIVEG